MERRLPGTGEIYRHFKNKLYQIVAIAEHSETGERLVIYQALYGAYKVYARPLTMFLSEVDRTKYPDVPQKYRFEQVAPADLDQDGAGERRVQADQSAQMDRNQKQQQEVPIHASAAETAETQEVPAPESEAGADPKLLEFLDADTFLEKYQVIKSMENEITDRLINDFAVVLDVVIPEGSLQQRYTQLKQCVATMCRYETARLR